ncbi:hypothetical protein ABZ723_22375 [Streptomyces sp. NPDC006700]|uniref:hypothetical protein n=1 Tax=unclassified Streptomyces TaxID=2593676 RepID=UPI0033DF9899
MGTQKRRRLEFPAGAVACGAQLEGAAREIRVVGPKSRFMTTEEPAWATVQELLVPHAEVSMRTPHAASNAVLLVAAVTTS